MNTTNQNNSCFQKRYKGVIKMNNLFEKNIEDLTLEEMEEIKEKFVVEFTNRLLQIAISKIEKLREGEIFFVREIFSDMMGPRKANILSIVASFFLGVGCVLVFI